MCPCKLDYPLRIKNEERSFSVAEKLLLGAGPSNVSPRVLMAMAQQTMVPLFPDINKVMDDVKEMLKYVYQTDNPITFLQQTSGTGGIEMAITNLVDPGDTVIVASSGTWGERTVIMTNRAHANTIRLISKPGEVYSLEDLEEAIIKHKPVALFTTHGESSGGVLQPHEGLAEICHKYNCLLVVDAVVSVACVPLFVDRWGLDVVIGGSQKAIGAPPGMALMTFSPRAHKRILEKRVKPPYYYDVLGLANAWKCFDEARTYHYTYNSNMLVAVREALKQICEEGLQNVWERHQKCAELLWKGLEERGIKMFVEKVENRFVGVTPIVLPSNVMWSDLVKYLSKTYNVDIGFGIGPTANKAVRIGVLGFNARPEVMEYMLNIIEDAMEHCKTNKINGTNGTNGTNGNNEIAITL